MISMSSFIDDIDLLVTWLSFRLLSHNFMILGVIKAILDGGTQHKDVQQEERQNSLPLTAPNERKLLHRKLHQLQGSSKEELQEAVYTWKAEQGAVGGFHGLPGDWVLFF